MSTAWHDHRALQALAVSSVVLLTVLASLCFFDGDHHGAGSDSHAIALDLCAGMLVASVTVFMPGAPAPGAWLRPAAPSSHYAASPRQPDHPPRVARAFVVS
jgi:hypothetical protein